MREAQFTIVDDDRKRLVIRDIGPWNIHPTVTNDAENVVAKLAKRLGKRKLFYYDAQGDLDEIKVVGGKFAGFAPGPQRTKERMR